MFIGVGNPIPVIANIPGPSRPGYSSGEKNMKFEVEVTEGSLDIGWYMNGRTFTGKSGWSYGMDIDWGDGNSTGELPYNGQTNRLVSHTYLNPGTYTITINWENAFVDTNAYYPLDFDLVSTANALKVKKWLSWGTDFVLGGTIRMFQQCRRLIYEAKDFPITYTPMTGQNWLLVFGDMDDWNTPINLSDWSVSKWTATNRYSNTFSNMFNLPELKLENETINSGTTINPWRDLGMTTNCGRDVANGTVVKFDNVNFEGSGAGNYAGFGFFYNCYIGKGSYVKNIAWETPSSSYTVLNGMFRSSYFKNVEENEDVTIDLSGWGNTSETDFKVSIRQIAENGFRKQGVSTATGILTLDFRSPYNFILESNGRNAFLNLTSASYWAGLTILGAENWSLNYSSGDGVRNMFYNCGTLDINLTNFDFTGVPYINSFLGGTSKLTTARYDEALIAWDNSGIQNIVNLRMNTSQYTAGGSAEAARNNLINNKGWSITDGGSV